MTSAGGLLQCGPEGGGTQGFIGGRDLDLAGISGILQQAVKVGFPQSIPVRRQTPEDDETVLGLDNAGKLSRFQSGHRVLKGGRPIRFFQ